MYVLKEVEARREPLEKTTDRRPSTHRNGAARPGACLRLVRVPGGFAYVADEPATSEA
ncbi:MAG TPA: hypothetical protein VHH10_07865 [Rubrobacteraceae bacterium]|jgi:hypothetical protein|nr:hypothetical protein [Rubrobacteraceae bacterium]